MKRDDGTVRYVSISTADKIVDRAHVTAHGTSTHSSMPRPDNAIFALSRAMAKLSTYETPLALTPATRQFFPTLAQDERAADVRLLSRPRWRPTRRERGAPTREISKDPLLHAMMRNTIAPVLMNAGFRSNVIPGLGGGDDQRAAHSRARDPRRDSSRELQRVIGDPHDRGEACRSDRGARDASAPSSEDTDLYRALENASARGSSRAPR